MSGYIGNTPALNATQVRQTFTATAGQTSFATAGYQVGYLDTFLNGIKLNVADVTATNGSDVVVAACAAGDILDVILYGTFDIANMGGAAFNGDVGVTGTVTADGLTLDGSSTDISDTAVDVFVYDTSKDSDGGAWRKRTQHTSWYNEAASATRGSRKEFPAVAVIVATSTGLTIYDGDDPDMPMWMVFVKTTPIFGRSIAWGNISSCSMLNGTLVFGNSASSAEALLKVNFISDNGFLYPVSSYSSYGGAYTSDIASRANSYSYGTSGTTVVVNSPINDVAMTVLPNAPIDYATGLPVPTIAVATNGGVSVIKDDGTVVDGTNTSGGSFAIVKTVSFDENNRLWYPQDSASQRDGYVVNIPSNDWTANNASNLLTGASGWSFSKSAENGNIKFIGSGVTDITHNSIGSDSGITFTAYTEDKVATVSNSPLSSLFAYTSSSYNTGWMNGAIKLATLSDTDATNVTGGTEADRSVNNNPLTVNGTVTKTPVATGADLVAYSGFSASNYLIQPYNSDLDVGTGDFCFMSWVKSADSAPKIIFHRGDGGVGTWGSGSIIQFETSGGLTKLQFYTNAFTSGSYASIGTNMDQGTWQHIVGVRQNGVINIYLNGDDSQATTATNSINVSNTSAKLWVGQRPNSSRPWNGSMALHRFSTTVPSPEQITKIYNDEKHLFQTGAQATLYGSSDAVTALAYDDTTDLLHVGTSGGRSVFQGLRRVDNTTDAVGAAISASNGLVAEE